MSIEETVARKGREYGFMQSAWRESPAPRRFTALDVPCPECQAATGERCTGKRVHQERLDIALGAMRSGKLDELPETGPADVKSGPCRDCGGQVNQRGRPVACSDTHRCSRRVTGGRRCAGAIVPPSRYCSTHVAPTVKKRWN